MPAPRKTAVEGGGISESLIANKYGGLVPSTEASAIEPSSAPSHDGGVNEKVATIGGSGKMTSSNVFTPNLDGINDLFEFYSDPYNIISVDEVLIFDRWGGIISHQANLFNEGTLLLWDGHTKWGPANPGVYVYKIKFTMADQSHRTVKGDVTVLK